MKRAYLANGTLAANATTKDATLQLDAATWTYLSNLLGTDYCYLIVGGKEVVKVQSVEAPSAALVVRALDGTRLESWPNGTAIKYGLTEAEINDAVTYTGLTLNVEYPLANNNGQISYKEMAIADIGGCTVDGSNEGGWMIQDIPQNAGCCSLVPETPPDIPLSYYDLRIVTEGYYRSTTQGDYRLYE